MFEVRAVGDMALLVDAEENVTVRRLTAWVAAHRCRSELIEVIPTARTLFVAGPTHSLRTLSQELHTAILPELAIKESRVVEVDVKYDGPDLAEVAEISGLSLEEIVDLHSGRDYTVEFFGFAPGQAFLIGLPSELRLPRRRSPRVRVPSGAVAIANDYTVVYPQDSPGGWNLIGTRVSPPLWDATADPPNAVSVGDLVRFRAVV
jgi:KipI family sensor histidine kinase inhibitor